MREGVGLGGQEGKGDRRVRWDGEGMQPGVAAGKGRGKKAVGEGRGPGAPGAAGYLLAGRCRQHMGEPRRGVGGAGVAAPKRLSPWSSGHGRDRDPPQPGLHSPSLPSSARFSLFLSLSPLPFPTSDASGGKALRRLSSHFPRRRLPGRDPPRSGPGARGRGVGGSLPEPSPGGAGGSRLRGAGPGGSRLPQPSPGVSGALEPWGEGEKAGGVGGCQKGEAAALRWGKKKIKWGNLPMACACELLLIQRFDRNSFGRREQM